MQELPSMWSYVRQSSNRALGSRQSCPNRFVRLRNANQPVSFEAQCQILTDYLLPQSGQSLLLGVSIDVSSNDERKDIEERNPSLLR